MRRPLAVVSVALVSVAASASIAHAQTTDLVTVRAARVTEGGRPAIAQDSIARSIADAERRISHHSRPPKNNPTWDAGNVDAGTPERKCVDVGDANRVRSGDFVASGFGLYNDPSVWWNGYGKIGLVPRHISNGTAPRVVVHATRLSGPPDGRVFESPAIAAGTGDRRPAFYATGIHVPTTGLWMLVATAGDNWGCFLLTVR